MNELILPPEPRRSRKFSPEKEPIEITIEPGERLSRPNRRNPLSALLGLAAIIGAGLYLFQFAQGAMPKQAPAVAAKEPETGLTEAQRQIAALQTEVRDLRAKLDAVEKKQTPEALELSPPAEPAKPAAESAKTEAAQEPVKAEAAPEPRQQPAGEAAPAPRKAAPATRTATAEPPAPVQKVAPTPQKIVSAYRLREAFRSNALVESRRGVIDVQPGDMLPGAGRVLSIERRAGRWVVATEGGDIVADGRVQPRASAPRRRVYREEYGYEPGPPMFMPY